MRDGTAEEYALINAREAAYNRTLHLRVLDAVRALGAAEPDPGYAVSRLAHCLQSATRAERDGRPVDYVVAALIHDIGDGLAPYSHGSFDPGYDWLPLEHFAPAVQEVFSRKPAFR
jgi:predicted HD phosphohydrolase